MYNHILISTDGSELAGKGLDHGLALAARLGARVTVVTVTEPYRPYSAAGEFADLEMLRENYDAGQKEIADGVLAGVSEAAAKAGVSAELLHVPFSYPAEAIVETAEKLGISLIVMASHGRRGLGRLILGSQTAEVLAHSKIPVLVVR